MGVMLLLSILKEGIGPILTYPLQRSGVSLPDRRWRGTRIGGGRSGS